MIPLLDEFKDSGMVQIGFARMTFLFANALVLGSALAWLTWKGSRNDAEDSDAAEAFSAASTVLYVCVGMCAIMILVSNSLARAFAIAAAIAMIRFRVKFEGKLLPMGIFYGVITGMACGVGRADIAWIISGLFGAIFAGSTLAQRRIRNSVQRRISAESRNLFEPSNASIRTRSADAVTFQKCRTDSDRAI